MIRKHSRLDMICKTIMIKKSGYTRKRTWAEFSVNSRAKQA